MKRSNITISAFLLVGCMSSHQPASLTAEQAKAFAISLANDKAFALYRCEPFRDGQPAEFIAGHWIWTGQQGFGRGDVQATVELAADGSRHDATLRLFDSTSPLF